MTRPGAHGNDPRREPLDPAERELAERLARLGPHGEPPVAVDTRILAAAHAATNATPRRARRLPLAVGVAASLVLALGLAWQLRPLLDAPPPAVESDSMDMAPRADGSQAATEHAEERAAAGDAGAEAGRAGPVAGPDRAQAVVAEPAAPPPPSAQETVQPEAFPSPSASSPPQPTPPPAPPPPAPAARTAAPAAPARAADTQAAQAADAGMRRRAAESQRQLEPRRDAAPQAMQESVAAGDGAGVQDAEAAMRQSQLERIRALRDAGHTAHARDELDAFLARWPGYPLPDDLQTLRR